MKMIQKIALPVHVTPKQTYSKAGMADGFACRVIRRLMPLFLIVNYLLSCATLSAQAEGGTLIREIRSLRDEVDRSRQGVEALQSHPQVSTGRERAGNLNTMLAAGDLEAAARAYERDLAEGFGAGFHRKIRQQAEAERDRNFQLYQRVLAQRARHAELRRDRTATSTSVDPLQEIAAAIQRNHGGDSTQSAEELLKTIQEVAEVDRAFLGLYPEAALEFFGDAGEVPPELLDRLAYSALLSFAQANAAAARSRRAEIFYQSFPQILRRRSEELEKGQVVTTESIRAVAREMF